jgi:hypothetical protein
MAKSRTASIVELPYSAGGRRWQVRCPHAFSDIVTYDLPALPGLIEAGTLVTVITAPPPGTPACRCHALLKRAYDADRRRRPSRARKGADA